MPKQPIIVITGPTACGKTHLAAQLAYKLNSEIISADSRQIFIGMDIGTGKDLSEYIINNKKINTHLIDIKQIGEDFSVYEFQKSVNEILDIFPKDKYPIICGGTAFYIEALIKNYQYTQIPPNYNLRLELENKTNQELISILNNIKSSYNYICDTSTKRRIIRSIEIARFLNNNNENALININDDKNFKFQVFAINLSTELRRELIFKRLEYRLQNGLIEEVEKLLVNNSAQTLISYGLEYKYISLYLLNELDFYTMKQELFIQICRYAKRQMTFLRRLEKHGLEIKWINIEWPLDKKLNFITNTL